MTTLHQEIVEKIGKLDTEHQRRVLTYVEDLLAAEEAKPKVVVSDWLKRVEAFQAELRVKYGEDFVVDSQSLLDELREEASWPRW